MTNVLFLIANLKSQILNQSYVLPSGKMAKYSNKWKSYLIFEFSILKMIYAKFCPSISNILTEIELGINDPFCPNMEM